MPYSVIEGSLSAKGFKFAIVVSRFNGIITERLLGGAVDALVRTGAAESDITVVRVPGSWELPIAAKALAESGKHDAVIALSALIKGETPHFDYIAAEASKGLGAISMQTGVPVAFGVLTTHTVEQAVDRAGAKSGNKGFDAAISAVEMVNLMRKLRAAK
jgi:6,7-dimethyl-8-ribityllumazine synthase